jgi:hypothetical protein
MQAQWENLVVSSLMLYVDHTVCSNGGYTNHSGEFYKTQKQYNQFDSYSLPFKQIVSDQSVSGANVMESVSIDGSLTAPSAYGLAGILHHKGTVLFDPANSPASSANITGSFAVKEFNIYITTKAEEDLLFKTAKQINPKLPQTSDGLDPNTEAYPAIFLKNMGGTMDPIGFGLGMDDTVSYVRAIVLSSSAFSLDAVCGLLKKSAKTKIPVIQDLPFNAIGAYTGLSYDYQSLSANPPAHAWLWNVSVSKIMPQTSGMSDLNLDVFAAFVDFEVRSFGSEL